MKVAMYGRVSTDKQEVENQLKELREFCKKKNWEIYGEYIDKGISGKNKSRPQFDEMFQDAHRLKFELVLFWALDRFSRSGTLFTLQKLKELENLGISWKSYTEQYFDSAGDFKDVVLSIMATLAKIEREKISERTKLGLKRIRETINKKGYYRTKDGRKITQLGRKPKNINEKRIWDTYKEMGSISKTAKLLPYSYGTVYNIIKKGTHN